MSHQSLINGGEHDHFEPFHCLSAQPQLAQGGLVSLILHASHRTTLSRLGSLTARLGSNNAASVFGLLTLSRGASRGLILHKLSYLHSNERSFPRDSTLSRCRGTCPAVHQRPVDFEPGQRIIAGVRGPRPSLYVPEAR
jgi:hypothetical protein